ncbi:MAG TPA: polysaccharide deacetylase family protein [Chloroflexota bacterium]|nr:polysaccharide deacetylase family protein [Chloroflexota bacterium]
MLSPQPPATEPDGIPTICAWPGDRRWVYSITFDEALSDLHRFTVPILEEFGVPGHLEVVVGQLGEVRNLPGSSFHGYQHMGAGALREMIARGWGVGNHSWSHQVVNAETADLELGRAKEVLEQAIGQPVTVYCAPGSNANLNEGALAGCRRFGYLGAMGITDALNRPDDGDLLRLNRTFLHTQGYGPFFSEFDPFRNIQHARRDQGWIIDYLHCPLEVAIHPNKDCSAGQLRERIATVVTEGADDVWLATVEEPADYRHTRRHAEIRPAGDGQTETFTITTPGLPAAVRRRTVTLALPVGTYAAEVDGRPAPLYRKIGKPLLDVDLSAERHVRLLRISPAR